MWELKFLAERRQKDETLSKRDQENIDTDVRIGYFCKIDHTELNETKEKVQRYLPHYAVINPYKPD